MLFVEVCRSIGLAARFVSGYQEGDLDNPERHLHAWAEVYLPGGGVMTQPKAWRLPIAILLWSPALHPDMLLLWVAHLTPVAFSHPSAINWRLKKRRSLCIPDQT